jgi:plasmid maintenance system antidote protein VapI
MRNKRTMTAAILKAIRDGDESIYSIAKATKLSKGALGRFVAGKQSLRLDLADRLAVHLGLELVKRKGR